MSTELVDKSLMDYVSDPSSKLLLNIIYSAAVTDWIEGVSEVYTRPDYLSDNQDPVWAFKFILKEGFDNVLEHEVTFKQLASAGNKWAQQVASDPKAKIEYVDLAEKILAQKWDKISDSNIDGKVGDAIVQIAIFGQIELVSDDED